MIVSHHQVLVCVCVYTVPFFFHCQRERVQKQECVCCSMFDTSSFCLNISFRSLSKISVWSTYHTDIYIYIYIYIVSISLTHTFLFVSFLFSMEHNKNRPEHITRHIPPPNKQPPPPFHLGEVDPSQSRSLTHTHSPHRHLFVVV